MECDSIKYKTIQKWLKQIGISTKYKMDEWGWMSVYAYNVTDDVCAYV